MSEPEWAKKLKETIEKIKEEEIGAKERQFELIAVIYQARCNAELTITLAEALDAHKVALVGAANASNTSSSRLVFATWALCAATLALFAQPFIAACIGG